jgi:hypothetical protein
MTSATPLHVGALAPADAAWLGRWRATSGLEACESGGFVWVRGPHSADWDRLPALARYTADTSGRLTPLGRRTPTARLPGGPWLPLAEFLRVRPPASALPALGAAPIAWTLVPSGEFRAPDLLLAPFDDFLRWGLSAPAVRLRPLRFAVSDDRRACISGRPLPALRGEGWSVQDGVALPAGWSLPPGFTSRLVVSTLKLQSGDIALIHPDATAEHLPAEAFIETTRSALRATAANL